MKPVRWSRSALNEVTDIWTRSDSPGRKAITEAVAEIDRRLGSDPGREGESRERGRRILFVSPLALTFEIDSEGMARVLDVWRYPPA